MSNKYVSQVRKEKLKRNKKVKKRKLRNPNRVFPNNPFMVSLGLDKNIYISDIFYTSNVEFYGNVKQKMLEF